MATDLQTSLRRLGRRELEARLGGSHGAGTARERTPADPAGARPGGGEDASPEPPPPAALQADLARLIATCRRRCPERVRVVLSRETEVWPGDVLADLTGERFFPAAGLLPEQLALLSRRTPTLGELERRFGPAWVEFHVLRLCLLGLIHLRGLSPP